MSEQINLYDHLLQHQVKLNPGTTKEDWVQLNNYPEILTITDLVNAIFFGQGTNDLRNFIISMIREKFKFEKLVLGNFEIDKFFLDFFISRTKLKIDLAFYYNEQHHVLSYYLDHEQLIDLFQDDTFCEDGVLNYEGKRIDFLTKIYLDLDRIANGDHFEKMFPELAVQCGKTFVSYHMVNFLYKDNLLELKEDSDE